MDRNRHDFVDRVDAAIKNSPHISRRDLQCKVLKDHVVLTGTVSSYYQKQLAQEAVRRVDGVQSIDNRLEVAWTSWKSQPADSIASQTHAESVSLVEGSPVTS